MMLSMLRQEAALARPRETFVRAVGPHAPVKPNVTD